jgi:predicted secreted acid phosphatase
LKYLIGLFSLALLLVAPPAFAASCPSAPYVHVPLIGQPANLGELKLHLLDYKCFGGYDRDVAQVLAEARVYIETRPGAVTNPAIVLDIDETSLSNWDEILADDFGFIPGGRCDELPKGPCGEHAWELLAKAPALNPTLELFKVALAKKIAIFFITGRNGDTATRAATEKNLKDAGYDGWTELIMRPDGSSTATVAQYKAPERAKIAAKGFTIIANIGDQASDLEGGYAERTFRVPNPFYFLP